MSNLWIFKEFCNVYFTKLLEDHRIPTNIGINERLWTGLEDSEQMEQVWRLYVGTVFYI